MATSKQIDPEDRALVEDMREYVRSLDYEPLDDEALADMHEAIEFGVADNATEGVYRTPRVAAFDAMLIEERVPVEVRELVMRRFMKAIAAKARADESVSLQS